MNSKLVDDKIKELFLSYRTIAIIGVSPDPKKKLKYNHEIFEKYWL